MIGRVGIALAVILIIIAQFNQETDSIMPPETKYFYDFVKKIPSLTNKVVVITGTSSGIGNVAAKTSLSKGATVVMLNRNGEKARKSLEDFFEEEKEAESRAHFVDCDLMNFESVKNAAEEVKEKFGDRGIDVLANNAGVMALADKATVDGYDVQMQTNHLSHFLLTRLLFPLLHMKAEEVGETRVVTQTSGARNKPPAWMMAAYFGKNGGNLGGDSSNMFIGGRWRRYQQSKLANSVFTTELQRRLTKASSKVISVGAHPGLTATHLQIAAHEDGGLENMGIMKSAQSAEDGTMGILTAMFLPDVEKGGLYGPWYRTGPVANRYHGIFTTKHAGDILWRESEKACGDFVIPNST